MPFGDSFPLSHPGALDLPAVETGNWVRNRQVGGVLLPLPACLPLLWPCQGHSSWQGDADPLPSATPACSLCAWSTPCPAAAAQAPGAPTWAHLLVPHPRTGLGGCLLSIGGEGGRLLLHPLPPPPPPLRGLRSPTPGFASARSWL